MLCCFMINDDIGMEWSHWDWEGSDNGIEGVQEADMVLSQSPNFFVMYGVQRATGPTMGSFRLKSTKVLRLV
jgi:hypothetical protein